MARVTQRWPFSNRFLTFVSLAGLLLSVFFFYIWHLGSLTVGFSQDEIDARAGSSSLNSINQNPVYAPQRLLQFGFLTLGQTGAFWMRLASVIFALVILFFFFQLLRLWFGKFISLVAAFMFAGTPIIILLARSATPEILLLFPVAVIGTFVFLTRAQNKNLAWLLLITIVAVSFYIPGLFITSAVAVSVYIRPLLNALKQVKPLAKITGAVLAIIILAPLIAAIAKNPGIYRSFVPLPPEIGSSYDILKSIYWSASGLFWRVENANNLILGRIPLLNAMQIILAFFGAFALWRSARREFYLISSILVLGIFMAAVNKNVLLLVLALPAVGVMVAAGIRYLYKEWRSVFPINPLPRALAIVLITSVVLLHLLIGARYSLIAWPGATATKNDYVIK